MGCNPSTATDPRAGGLRKRLTGSLDGGIQDAETTEEDLSFFSTVTQADVMKMLDVHGARSDRRVSIGSHIDMGKLSFSNKTFVSSDDKFDSVKMQLGFTCRKGLKPESPNQDSWCCIKVPGNFSLYGVFDGHGQKGHDVSYFVKDNLPKLIIKDPRFRTDELPTLLKESFCKVQRLVKTADAMQKVSARSSGTTATVVVHDEIKQKLTVAHVADSTAVIGRKSKQGWEAIQLTRDHKPQLKEERSRIERSGGKVVFDGYANYRVYAQGGRYPGLNMSRCIGDLLGHKECGITAEPEVSERDISEFDKVLMICSDGVWEFITPMQAVNIVSEKPNQVMPMAEKLAKEAWDRWIREEGGAVVDDITVVLVPLQPPRNDSWWGFLSG
jgi:serine/threonine protein phosphatase PrpC